MNVLAPRWQWTPWGSIPLKLYYAQRLAASCRVLTRTAKRWGQGSRLGLAALRGEMDGFLYQPQPQNTDWNIARCKECLASVLILKHRLCAWGGSLW